MEKEIDLEAYFKSEEHQEFLKGQMKRNQENAEAEKRMKEKVANLDKAKEMMDFLGIPTVPNNMGHWHEVYAVDLYEIFTDKEKLQVLISKLRNQAFW